MPVEVFGPGYQFLPREEILTFGELVRTVRAGVELGVTKVRLTGGEPLLRRGVEDLVALIAAVPRVDDLAMTTNGILLNHHAEGLVAAGLSRVTVSLDALDEKTFSQMNGVGSKLERVLTGIETAQRSGLPVKVNMVVQRGVNEQEILPMVRWGREQGVTVRLIEFMDVGETNGWDTSQVVTAKEILAEITRELPVIAVPASYPGEVAQRWEFEDGRGEFGIISSVSAPFCSACDRSRLTADGLWYLCLYAQDGYDLRSLVRAGCKREELLDYMREVWSQRDDRGAEERQGDPARGALYQVEDLQADPHREMHTRGG